jgi:predicted permease
MCPFFAGIHIHWLLIRLNKLPRGNVSIFLQDVRFALRQLWKHPGFTLTSIFSLALGIAATVSVFSVIYSVLVNPSPYPQAKRIVQISARGKTGAEDTPYIQANTLRTLRNTRAFAQIVEIDEEYQAETSGDIPQDVDVVFLSGDSFPFFGVPALLGRTFLPSDAPEGQAPQPVVVLTYQYWQRRFNGNPAILGQQLRLNGRTYTILGVMPIRFTWWDADVYVPLNTAEGHSFIPVMRLRPGISLASATAEIQPIMQQMVREHPSWLEDMTFDVRTVDDRFYRAMGSTLYLLFAAVGLLMGIGCGNVSILLLARGTARQHEFGVRAAVGASSWRIVRQLLTESLILGMIGAIFGVLVTYRSTPFVVSLLPWQLFPRGLEIPVHVPVLVFSVLLTLVTSLFFGLFPAIQVAKPEIREIMQANTQKAAGNVAGRRLHSILIAGQIALAMVLLTAAGAAIQSFRHLLNSDLGYDPQRVGDFSIPVHPEGHNTWESRANYFQQLRDKVAQTPGATAASLALIGPPYSAWDFPMEILGQNALGSQLANINYVDSGYFSLLRIALFQGRLWSQTEAQHGARLAIVNQTFAHRYFPNGDVLGHSVRIPRLKNNPPYAVAAEGSDGWLPIVGVVGDARNDGLDKPVKPEIYIPYSLFMIDDVQILVKTKGDPLALERSVRSQVASINPGQQISYPALTLDDRLAHLPEWARQRLIAVLSGTFSGLALVLAAVGLYSVVSYSVGQRRHEFGIRMALGAQRWHILQNVLATAGISVGAGLIAGLALSFSLHSLLSRWIEHSTRNPLLVLASGFLLLAVALAACIVPAFRASLVQPMKALRTE